MLEGGRCGEKKATGSVSGVGCRRGSFITRVIRMGLAERVKSDLAQSSPRGCSPRWSKEVGDDAGQATRRPDCVEP